MSQVPDLVKDAELETRFGSDYLMHIYTETGPSAVKQVIHRKEYWIRKKRIGAGSYGSVWLEQCVKGQRGPMLRAVKKIVTSSLASEQQLYKRELEAISKFSHQKYERRFVKSFGWYKSDLAVYIAMEYLQHGDLLHYLHDNPPLSEASAKQIIYQVMEGLSLMHQNGFSHRDIKPGNILIKSQPPEPWWIKLGDFGISKRAADSAAATSIMRGTLEFMAPELLGFVELKKEPDSTNAQVADIWAAGATAFQILTKQALFESPVALSKYVKAPESFPIDALRAQKVSAIGVSFIKDLTQPDPKHRCTSDKALHHRWLEDLNVHGAVNSTQFSQLSALSQVPSQATQSTNLSQDMMPPPSGKWSTVSAAVPQLTSSTREMNVAPVGEHADEAMSDVPQDTARHPDTASQVRRMPVVPTARFFVMKSRNEVNIETSAAHGIWCCNPQTNTRLSNAYGSIRGPTFLIFSVNESRQFCGVAQMMSPWSPHVDDTHWEDGDWDGGFHVEWISFNSVHFDDVSHLKDKEVDGVSVTRGLFTLELCMSTGREMLRRLGVTELFDRRAPRRALQHEPPPPPPPPLSLASPPPSAPRTLMRNGSTVGTLNVSRLGLGSNTPRNTHVGTTHSSFVTRDTPPSRRNSTSGANVPTSRVRTMSGTDTNPTWTKPPTVTKNTIANKRSSDRAFGTSRVNEIPRKRISTPANQFSFTRLMAEWPQDEDKRKVS